MKVRGLFVALIISITNCFAQNKVQVFSYYPNILFSNIENKIIIPKSNKLKIKYLDPKLGNSKVKIIKNKDNSITFIPIDVKDSLSIIFSSDKNTNDTIKFTIIEVPNPQIIYQNLHDTTTESGSLYFKYKNYKVPSDILLACNTSDVYQLKAVVNYEFEQLLDYKFDYKFENIKIDANITSWIKEESDSTITKTIALKYNIKQHKIDMPAILAELQTHLTEKTNSIIMNLTIDKLKIKNKYGNKIIDSPLKYQRENLSITIDLF